MNDRAGPGTLRLLRAGAAAGPLYIVVGLAQVFLREGFDVRRHALSLLSNGEYGWVQVANFIVCGLLVLAGALGTRRQLKGQAGGTWLPILFATFGLGLVGAGLFRADPGQGFPPGTTPPLSMTRDGMLHFVFGALGFYALIAAAFVLARRYARIGWPRWMVLSLMTGIGFFLAFAAIASGQVGAPVMLTFYAAVAWIWLWHSRVMATMVLQPRLEGWRANATERARVQQP